MNTYQVRIQAIATANDDGSQASTVTATALTKPIQDANAIFAAAGVELLYDPATDFVSLNNTVLNNTETILGDLKNFTDPHHEPPFTKDPNTRARTNLAGVYPQKLVIYFSFGTETYFNTGLGHWDLQMRTSGSSGWDGAYVSMDQHLPPGTSLAHEVGHYLQLSHPFDSNPTTKAVAAQTIHDYVVVDGHPREEGLDVFDGDRYSVGDTPPDARGTLVALENPTIHDVNQAACGPVGTVHIPVDFDDGTPAHPKHHTRHYELTPDRSLVMSYFKGCSGQMKFSPHQITRIRKGLETGIRHRLISLQAGNLKRLVARKGSGEGGAVSEVDVTQVADGRVVTAVRNRGGNLELIVWDVNKDGTQVTRKGDIEAGAATNIRVCGFALGLVVTALRDDNHNLKLIAWQIKSNGDIERKGDELAGAVKALAMCRISIEYLECVIIAVREQDKNNLKLISWRLTPEGSLVRMADANAGDVKLVSISPAGIDGVATYVQDSDGNLKVIIWEVTSETISRRGEATAGAIDDVSGCHMDLDVSVAAVRTNGHLKVIAWRASQDQLVLERQGDSDDDAGAVNEIATCRMGTDLLVTAVRDANDKLKVILWELVADGVQVTRRDSDEEKACSQIAVCYAGPALFTTAVRGHDGNLKVSAWQVS